MVVLPFSRWIRVVCCLLALACGAVLAPHLASGQDEGQLRDRISGGKQREQQLGSAAARLGRLERQVGKEVAILQRRIGDVEGNLAAARTRLLRSETGLAEQTARLTRTRERLDEARKQLAVVLLGRYQMDVPDLTDVVLSSDGFGDLLSRMEFVGRVADRDAQIVRDVRDARNDAKRRTGILRPLVAKRRAATDAVERQRDALGRISEALGRRQALLQRARAARLAALRSTRKNRKGAEKALDKLLAERAKAAKATGPGGPWSIPWAVVECESGGQNLPPNFAGASGYYQFMPATWKGMGGSTPHAYQASKAEQDRLAAKLWDGGKGARNWVCAGLVGLL